MSEHIADDLPRLLTGDAAHSEVLAAAEHLRSCPDCQQELVAAVVAHASLTSAHRFAPDVVAPPPTRPHPSSVTRIHAGEDVSDEPDPLPDRVLPDLSGVFERARDEAAATVVLPSGAAASAPTPMAARRGRRGLIAAAAAAVVLAGGGAAVGYGLESGGGSSGHTVALDSYDVGTSDASATVGSDWVRVDAASLPDLGVNRRYEVWLTNGPRTKMYSIGFLGDQPRATFVVKRSQLDRFSDIEVSVQPAGKIDYSGTSVLRGSYS